MATDKGKVPEYEPFFMPELTEKSSTAERYLAAMRLIGFVAKDQEMNQSRNGGGGVRYKFRGIDDVMNAAGPAFRKCGLGVIPEVMEEHYERVPKSSGGMMASTRVKVRYTFISNATDQVTGISIGESNDTADKATAKAMSVAFRTFLLQSLVLPTDEEDPDKTYNEIGQQQPPKPLYEQPGFNPQTASKPQLLQAVQQAHQIKNFEMEERLTEVGKRRFAPSAENAPEITKNQAAAAENDVDPWAEK